DHAETHRVMVAAGYQRSPCRRAQRRRVEAVVREPSLAEPIERRGADRSAEATWVAEARVVGQNEQHVRRAFGGGNWSYGVPVRLGAVERPFHLPLKLWPPDRQLGAVDRLVAHVALPPSRCSSSLGEDGS